MRVIVVLITAMTVAGCTIPILNIPIFEYIDVSTSDPVIAAQPFIGLEERANREELKELMSVDPVRYEWCAAFVNAILELENIPNLNDIEHPHPLLARAFLQWGEPVEKENIQRGDLVVFPRGNEGWQGHVGFYVETVVEDDVEYWVILGGNQDQSVSYAQFNPNSSIGIRRYPINTTVQSAQ
jgi:uncharacterized protein (TIGR02594 family)